MMFINKLNLSFVRLTGLEPARREALDPKSSVSTNSTTGAWYSVSEYKGSNFSLIEKRKKENIAMQTHFYLYWLLIYSRALSMRVSFCLLVSAPDIDT